MPPILPGATIGVFGSGQLGRMMALAARNLGYRIHCFSPDRPGSPTGQVADREVSAPYTDLDAVADFVRQVDNPVISVGHHAMRGIGHSQELFRLRPE